MKKELEAKLVSKQLPEFARILDLYEESFPEEERFPFLPLLYVADEMAEVEFLAYYDAGKLCGFSYTIAVEGYLYILYLAVEGQLQSRGYGAAILGFLAARFPGSVHVLEVEPIDPQAENAAQRESRLSFYERNGFAKTGYDMIEEGVRYTMLSTHADLDVHAFKAAIDARFRGMFAFELLESKS